MAIAGLVIIAKKSSSQNGFNRVFYKSTISPLYYSEKLKGSRDICGIKNNAIYFETGIPGVLIETDSTLSNEHSITFDLPARELIQTLFTTFVDSATCYIMAANIPLIIKVDMNTKSYNVFHFPGQLYSESIALGENDYVFRCYKKFSGKLNQVFVKGNPVTNSLIEENNISEKKGDAGFSSDGHLLFDGSTHRVVYLEYYSNHFICMDTLLHLIYRSHTIDTFNNETVKAVWNKTGQAENITNGSPLHEINLESTAANGKLYVHSAIKADNERKENFLNNSVIDVYQISNGHYLHSFYIPQYKGENMKGFGVAPAKLIVLYHDFSVAYSIPFNL